MTTQESWSVLVVDDERNIRVTMVHALESSGLHVESALTGEEALLMLEASPFDLLFLDLKLPGVDGLEVLRRSTRRWPGLCVVVITAHGTVDAAVEAMKLGAADFIQKPFTPDEIREAAFRVLAPAPEVDRSAGYGHCMAEARRFIEERQLDTARAYVRQAVGLDPTRPDAFNLLGVAVHLGGDRFKAQSYFRAALALDPTYAPARANLEHSVFGGGQGRDMELSLGADLAAAT